MQNLKKIISKVNNYVMKENHARVFLRVQNPKLN